MKRWAYHDSNGIRLASILAALLSLHDTLDLSDYHCAAAQTFAASSCRRLSEVGATGPGSQANCPRHRCPNEERRGARPAQARPGETDALGDLNQCQGGMCIWRGMAGELGVLQQLFGP